MNRSIKAVAVVVPAHNEQERLPSCLDSVADALGGLPKRIRTSVCVVADRCTDATGVRALAMADRFDAFSLVVSSPLWSLGEVRNHGAVRASHALLPVATQDTWLLHTDADTVVPSTWALDHVALAELGAHAVAGRAVIRRWAGPALHARHRYEALVAEGVRPERHEHVYGANLGVRADVFTAVGGFPAVPTGEDHALWQRLARAGALTWQPNGISVFTSGRTRGRAEDGLAALLHALSTSDSCAKPPAVGNEFDVCD